MMPRIPRKEEALEGAERTEEYSNGHRKMVRLLYNTMQKELKDLDYGGRCLEIGAGPGWLATTLAHADPQVNVTALDLSNDMARVAEGVVARQNLQDRVRYVVADVADGEAMKHLGSFDLVYSTLSLHHWRNPEAAIANLWDRIDPGGILYVHDLKRVWWLYYVPLKGNFATDVRAAFRPHEMAALLRGVGAKQFRIRTTFPGFMQSVVAWK